MYMHEILSKANKIFMIRIILILFSLFITYPANGICQKAESMKQRDQGEEESELDDKLLILVGDIEIMAADLKEYLVYRPLPSPASFSDELINQRLDEMITSEALYQEGVRLNIHEDPDVKRMIHQIVIQRLQEEYVERKVWNRKIEDNEVQAFYDKQKYQWNRPQQVRLADIFFDIDPKASAEQRQEKKKKAESVLAEVLEKGRGRYKFSELIRKYSDKHPKYSKGDTNYFDAEGKPLGIDKKLAEEAFKLKRIGEICDHLIECSEGYHIIMLVEKRPALKKSLEEVKGLIERQIRKEELEEKRQGFINDIKEKANIKRNEEAITEVIEELKENYIKEKEAHGRKQGRDMPPPFPGEY